MVGRIRSTSGLFAKIPQDWVACGNYPCGMAEAKQLSSSGGSAGRPVDPGIDWAVTLADHDRWLRTVVYTRLGEGQAVDEVMQEVALAAVAQRAPLADIRRVGAWLYRLAVRQALLYRRKRGRQRRIVEAYVRFQADGQPHSPCRDPLDGLLRDERRALVRAALERLPRRDAEILLLKYTEDWSYRELAERLGVSESAVEARLHRARSRLRAAMMDADASEVLE